MATPNWDFLLAEAAIASVLPQEYAHFTRPVREGLTIFLSGLPEADQRAILRAQASLSPHVSITQRLGVLAQCSPVLQKLGQVLARDQRLSPELRLHLRKLESLPPTVPLETIQAILNRELGPLENRGVTLTPPALAEASVAVVIPFRQDHDDTSVGHAVGARGVFKILKPGIEERLEFELSLLQRVGEHLDQRCDELNIPHLDYQDSFQQVTDKLVDEVQLENEQRHLAEANRLFAGDPQVQIPELFAHCTSRVTAMTQVSGVKVTDHHLKDGVQKRQLASLIARKMIAKPIFARHHEALFHGDPHAGNLFLTDDGRLAILDWSLVGKLGERDRQTIVQVMLGAITLDGERITALLQALSNRRLADPSALRAVVRAWLRRVRHGEFPGLYWLIGLLDEAVQNAQLRVGGDLMLFRKTLHTLAGVIAEVGKSRLLDEVIFTEFLSHFSVEWPHRWLSLPHSRNFSTHLSNFDLTRTMLSYPTAVARFWSGHTRDVMESASRQIERTMPVSGPATHSKSELQLQPETLCPSNA